jgi:hypothetical protein
MPITTMVKSMELHVKQLNPEAQLSRRIAARGQQDHIRDPYQPKRSIRSTESSSLARIGPMHADASVILGRLSGRLAVTEL